MMYKKININGGKRLDSVSANTAPLLTHSTSAQLVKGVNELIMKLAQKQYQSMRAQTDRQSVLFLLKYYICSNTFFLPPHTGPTT